VSQTGFTAEPAASRSDDVSWSTFSAAAAANEGLTAAGSAFAFAVMTVVVASSIVGCSVMMRSVCPFVTRPLGVRPCRIVSGSVVASSLVWWTQKSDPAASVRAHASPLRRRAAQRGNAGMT